MRVLVTGGRGLLGTAVTRELVARGHNVVTFQRHPSGSGAVEVLGDITSPEQVRSAVRGAQGVVHLAAKVSMTGPEAEFARVNVTGTAIVLDEAIRARVERFVQVSSPSVAHTGRSIVGGPAEPADAESARGPYSRTKAAAEELALSADGPDLAVTAVRPHLVWGPGDTQLVERIIDRARSGRLVLLNGGSALIDSTYIDNAADAIAQALERTTAPQVHGRAFVVSNGEPRTVAELLGRMAQAAGLPAPTRSVPAAAAIAAGAVVEQAWRAGRRDGEPPMTRFVAEQLSTAHWFDQRETRAALDWSPRISLAEGFTRLAEWYAAS